MKKNSTGDNVLNTTGGQSSGAFYFTTFDKSLLVTEEFSYLQFSITLIVAESTDTKKTVQAKLVKFRTAISTFKIADVGAFIL